MRAIFVFAVICTLASVLFAQSDELRFEVSSVRRLGKGGPAPNIPNPFQPGGRFRDPGTNLRNLIETAYGFNDLGMKIVGLPKWAEETAYAIDAKAGPEYPASVSPRQNEENIKAMLRAMLADRFQLKIRREERETKVLVLQAKKGGPKLTEVPAPVPPEKEGFLEAGYSDRRGAFRGKKVRIANLAASLTLMFKQRVVDQTGLTGFYDFDAKWEVPRREGEPTPANTFGPDGQAQVVSVLDQDLGLVLKPETLPADFWVVDRIEMPGEN